MQSLSQIGNARREERVLLPTLIELRSEQGDEALTADGLDVSPSGVAVRAAFVPEVGTRLVLSFRCPPHDDAVHGLGEVMWSAWDGPRTGSFGMRFLELDTKGATAIRRYVAPETDNVEDEPELPRSATMRIDGLGAPIEADVRLYDQSCIVLEQELSFLRLGRGIEVDVPGRGTQRGRIASIELRQGSLDTPTLVFGVLLDEQKARVEIGVEVFGNAGASGERESAHAHDYEQEDVGGEADQHVGGEADQEVAIAARVAVEAPREKRRSDEPRVVRVKPSERAAAPVATGDDEDDEDDEVERALKSRMPDGLSSVISALALTFAWLRGTLFPALLAGGRALRGMFRSGESAGEGEEESGPSRFLVSLARLRSALAFGFARVWKSMQKQRTTAPVPRVQRSAASVRPQQRAEPVLTAPRNRRWLTVSLAAVGVGLGVYALAPRSGADRLRVPRAEPSALRVPAAEPNLGLPLEISQLATGTGTTLAPLTAQEARPSAHEPSEARGAREPKSADKTATVHETARELSAEAPEPASLSPRFGESNVPNGRIFVLRMSGPVKSLEGESREDGFSVRIPGRLALDRASPIATSHRAVARALILNRGEYAELTVEFLPGMRPKYQVTAKESSIEVTLERL